MGSKMNVFINLLFTILYYILCALRQLFFMKYNTNTFVIVLIFLLISANSLKIFLLGGAVSDDQADIYTAMTKETGKTPQPYNCSEDWSTTSCPKVAVVTSAAQN